jgi:hypothetical protein
MSGIVGIVDFSGRPVERAHLEMMTGKLAHRGPDDIQHWLEGNVGLGHRMLHTTPESLSATHPSALFIHTETQTADFVCAWIRRINPKPLMAQGIV